MLDGHPIEQLHVLHLRIGEGVVIAGVLMDTHGIVTGRKGKGEDDLAILAAAYWNDDGFQVITPEG
jgi:hypothetical protein